MQHVACEVVGGRLAITVRMERELMRENLGVVAKEAATKPKKRKSKRLSSNLMINTDSYIILLYTKSVL
jgi:hypothetical protein